MKKRRRFIPPDKARAAVQGGFYQTSPLPGTFTCSVCGEERNSIGQADGVCLRCRWTRRAKERQGGGAALGTFPDSESIGGVIIYGL